MAVSAAAVAYAISGGLILYSGIKGATIAHTVQAALSGNLSLPGSGSANQDEPVKAVNGSTDSGSGSSPSSGSTPSGGTNAPGGASETSFFTAVLKDLGAPATQANLSSLTNWAHQEEPGWNGAGEGGTTFNPLNHSGSGINVPTVGTEPVGPGIAEYANATLGAQATADFLQNGNYPAIVMALRAGQGLAAGNQQVEAELYLWSSGYSDGSHGGYGSV